MEPITRDELFMAAAAGEYSGKLPEPVTRSEYYLKKIKEAVVNGSSVAPEDIDAAIEAYLNSHDADIVTEQELSDALAGYYDKDAVDTVLNEKQNMLTAGDNISIETVNGELTISATDTTYSDATQQTHGLMSTADKTKLDGITAAKMQAWDAAEQNVNADWTAESGDAQILHKPDLSVYALATNVTKFALGIDNVDNTSDADKPISTAAETALAGKVDKETNKSLMSADEHTKLTGIETGAQVNTVTGVKGSNEAEYRTGNVSITKGNVGLGNVDNTADTDKPISTAAQTALDGKVDKITGKGLSEANFTDAEKTKLAGIAAGAEVNVQSDWNQGDDAADDYIKNKPANLVQDASYVHTDNNFNNAEKAKADGAIQSTEKGAANGVAELDANGKVPTSQLPAYVDDVLSYNSLSDFPASGEDGKIYIAKDTNLSYRWGSSEYVVISPSLALGSTSSTAYRGDWGAEDRAAIGTLSTLNTTEKNNLVGAINELKTASDAKQGTLTFDSAPASGSTNPVTSGGVYTALTGKQGTLTFDSSPTENSDNPVKSGGVYTALAGKADAQATQTALNSKADATATQTALAEKQNALTAGANITIETVNDALTISATDTTYSNATSSAAGLMSAADKTKLDGIESGAEANVQSDWNQSDTTADDFIKNKPTNASASAAGLMSAADFKKINAQNITSGSDLNDIKGEGWYACYTSSAAATLSHCPTTMSFYMEVHKHAGVYQHIVEYSTAGAKHFHRNFYSNVWGDWVEWKLTDTTYSNAAPSTNGVGGSAGLMSAADKAKLDGMTAVLNAEILFDSPSGAIVTNASPSITFDTGKSISGITDGYLEVLFKQNSGTNGGVNSARALIHTVSGSVVVEPVQLLGWEYDSANSALALTGCAGTVSNGNTLTFANAESAAFAFTVYRVIAYS